VAETLPNEQDRSQNEAGLFLLTVPTALSHGINDKCMKTRTKVLWIISLIILLGLAAFFYFRFYFVLGTGVKSGELNQFELKGYVFKTYEGKVIQAGFRGGKLPKGQSGTSIESYIFDFSVDKDDVSLADSLMRLSGKTVELHYKEYLGALPWRGESRYVVDRIEAISNTTDSGASDIMLEY